MPPCTSEHDGSRRMYPFSRKIALATSMDKGRTWRYEGDIITSETYYYPYDFFKFSGSSYGIGVADFGFYADERGGYFYVFPDEGWAPWSTRGMRWNSRVARCAIRDKMAPGKWSYFYNGKWTESALGGKSSIVAPSHFWGITYSTVLEKYICMFTANQDPPIGENIDGIYIGCCTDLGKQDWVWGHCQEAMFGFMNLINNDGTDVARTCADGFRLYTYFAENDFQRLDFTLTKGQTSVVDLQPRFLFEPHPESSDPTLGRRTRIVGCMHPEVKYTGEWKERNERDSYEGRAKELLHQTALRNFSLKEQRFTGAPCIHPQAERRMSTSTESLQGKWIATVLAALPGNSFSISEKTCRLRPGTASGSWLRAKSISSRRALPSAMWHSNFHQRATKLLPVSRDSWARTTGIIDRAQDQS